MHPLRNDDQGTEELGCGLVRYGLLVRSDIRGREWRQSMAQGRKRRNRRNSEEIEKKANSLVAAGTEIQR